MRHCQFRKDRWNRTLLSYGELTIFQNGGYPLSWIFKHWNTFSSFGDRSCDVTGGNVCRSPYDNMGYEEFKWLYTENIPIC